MPSLTDLFNPSFLMFLGILVLVVALLIVYLESKMRDQNHKIASMLSLVSTLAEDLNGVKMGLNQLAINTMGGSMPQHIPHPLERNNIPFSKEENNLIEVSDDEDDESEINDDVIDSSNGDSESDSDNESDDENESTNDIKVLKLTINNEDNIQDIDETNLEYEEPEDIDGLEELEELDDNLSEVNSVSSKNSKLSSGFVENVLELKYDDNSEQPLNISSSDLKTISINLEESHSESLDYKKLQLNKLRSIVVEKGLTTDSSKLKKNELLKLLGVE